MSKIIALTRGFEAIVDDEDYDMLIAMGKWCTNGNRGNIYAVRNEKRNGKKIIIGMHRIIMNEPNGLCIDHINGDALDNRKSNLRICSHAENIRNGKKGKNCSSSYKGVGWFKLRKKWRARIMIDYKDKHLGLFSNEIDAAKAYDEAARELHGEFARLNFPKKIKCVSATH